MIENKDSANLFRENPNGFSIQGISGLEENKVIFK